MAHFPKCSTDKEYACNPGDTGYMSSMPGLGRSPGGRWQPAPIFLPENPMDRGAWQATVQKGCKESDMTEWLSTEAHTHTHTRIYVYIPFSRESSQSRDQTQVSRIQVDSLPAESSEKPNIYIRTYIITIGMCVLVTQSCPALCNLMNCNPPGSSVHEILQARILEWVAMLSSRGSSWPRNWSLVSLIEGRFFTVWATRENYIYIYIYIYICNYNTFSLIKMPWCRNHYCHRRGNLSTENWVACPRSEAGFDYEQKVWLQTLPCLIVLCILSPVNPIKGQTFSRHLWILSALLSVSSGLGWGLALESSGDGPSSTSQDQGGAVAGSRGFVFGWH